MTEVVWKLVTVFGPLVVEKALDYLASTTKKGKAMNQSEKKALANILKASPKGEGMSEEQLDKTLQDVLKVVRTPGLIEGSIKTIQSFWGWVTGKVKEDGTLNIRECEQEVKRLRKELRDCHKACEKAEKPKASAKPAAAAESKPAAAESKPSKAASPWIAHVKAYYEARKKTEPGYKYVQAMKDAKATYKK